MAPIKGGITSVHRRLPMSLVGIGVVGQSFLLLTGERIRNATAASPLGLRLPPPSLLRQMPGSQHETLTLSVCIFQKIGAFFANHHAGNARINTNHGRKYGGVCYSQVMNAIDTQVRIDNGELIVPV